MSVGVDTGVVMMGAILSAGRTDVGGGREQPGPGGRGASTGTVRVEGAQSSGVKRTPDAGGTGREDGARRTPASARACRAASSDTEDE